MKSVAFSERAEEALKTARQEAERFNSPGIGSGHLLLGLIKTIRIQSILIHNGIDPETVRMEIEKKTPYSDAENSGNRPYSEEIKQTLALAGAEIRINEPQEIDVDHLILGLCRIDKGIGKEVLDSLKIGYPQMLGFMGKHDEIQGKRLVAMYARQDEQRAKDLEKVRAQIAKHETPEARAAFDKVCVALTSYLTLMGWEHTLDFSGWRDPLTGDILPSSDLAFMRETDRYNHLTMERKLAPKEEQKTA